jgi:hypothetical protein
LLRDAAHGTAVSPAVVTYTGVRPTLTSFAQGTAFSSGDQVKKCPKSTRANAGALCTDTAGMDGKSANAFDTDAKTAWVAKRRDADEVAVVSARASLSFLTTALFGSTLG